MKLYLWLVSVLGLIVALVTGCDGNYESMYGKTKVDQIEIKDLPQRTALQTAVKTNYFTGDNDMFMKLFRYIQRNEVKMTVPVEAEMEPGTMRFFAGQDVTDRKLDSDKEVTVVTLPPRKVASIGVSGAYTRENFEKAQKKLTEWLGENDEWKADGEPYGVFWNSPFVPNMMKHSEVHVPVTPAS